MRALEKVGRNEPCPCGSGAKYKRCCLPKDEADRRPSFVTATAASTMRLPPGARIEERNGEQLLVSRGMSDEQAAGAMDYFDRKDRIGGPAQQMRDFIEPLVRKTDGSPDAVRRMWSLGLLCWNLALLESDEAREEAAVQAEKLFSEEARGEFRGILDYMVRRHRLMFPDLHAKRARAVELGAGRAGGGE